MPAANKSMELTRTGEKVAFLDISIGSPFFAHNRFWVRTSYDAATELHGSSHFTASTCNFLLDGTVRPVRGPYHHDGEVCEEVEAVACSLDPG